MAKFSYTAVDARGKQANGTIEANDQTDAIAQIRQLGFYPQRLDETRGTEETTTGDKPKLKKKGGKVKSKILVVFTRQLATLIDAGLPLLRSINTLARQERNPVMRNTMTTIATSVESGSTFSEALAQHPGIFNKLYVNMVKAGELGGMLEIALTRLAEFQEKSQKIKGKVTSALVYPIVVLGIAMIILSFLLIFIVPKFQQIFADALPGQSLPGITLFVMSLSHIMVSQWYLVLGGIAAVVVGFKLFSSTPAGAIILDQLVLKLPIFGDLVSKSSISRFSRTLGTLISSGVPILQALNITRDTAGNHVVATAITKIHDSVKEGESVVGPMESSGVFPPMVTSMVQVGEETGQLPDMLVKVADVYEGEVDNVVTSLTSILEPIMIVFLAVIVGTIVIALFMPMVKLITGMSAGGGGGLIGVLRRRPRGRLAGSQPCLATSDSVAGQDHQAQARPGGPLGRGPG